MSDKVEIDANTALFICLAMDGVFEHADNTIKSIVNELIEICKVTECLTANANFRQIWFCNKDVAEFILSDKSYFNMTLSDLETQVVKAEVLGLALNLITNDLRENDFDVALIREAIYLGKDSEKHISKLVLKCFELLFMALPKDESQRVAVYPSELIERYFELKATYGNWCDNNQKLVQLYKNKKGGKKAAINRWADNFGWHLLRRWAVYQAIKCNIEEKFNLDCHGITMLAWRTEFVQCKLKDSQFYEIGLKKYHYSDFDEYIEVLNERRQLKAKKSEYHEIHAIVKHGLKVHETHHINQTSEADFLSFMTAVSSNWELNEDLSMKPPRVALSFEMAQIEVNNQWFDIKLHSTIPEFAEPMMEVLEAAMRERKTKLDDSGVQL